MENISLTLIFPPLLPGIAAQADVELVEAIVVGLEVEVGIGSSTRRFVGRQQGVERQEELGQFATAAELAYPEKLEHGQAAPAPVAAQVGAQSP